MIRCEACGRSIPGSAPEWVIYGADRERSFCSFECLEKSDPVSASLFGALVRSGDAFFRPAYRRIHDPIGDGVKFL